MLSAIASVIPAFSCSVAFAVPSFDFDFSSMVPEQIVCAFVALGFSSGFVVHWIAKAGTAARWALNSSS
jgi:hypothetical protein